MHNTVFLATQTLQTRYSVRDINTLHKCYIQYQWHRLVHLLCVVHGQLYSSVHHHQTKWKQNISATQLWNSWSLFIKLKHKSSHSVCIIKIQTPVVASYLNICRKIWNITVLCKYYDMIFYQISVISWWTDCKLDMYIKCLVSYDTCASPTTVPFSRSAKCLRHFWIWLCVFVLSLVVSQRGCASAPPSPTWPCPWHQSEKYIKM